jgi:hypothetical protein
LPRGESRERFDNRSWKRGDEGKSLPYDGRSCLNDAVTHPVNQDVPPFHVAAGNPARVLRKVETAMDPSQHREEVPANTNVASSPKDSLAEQANS